MKHQIHLVLVTIIVACFAACGRGSGRSFADSCNSSCAAKASRGALDKACVVELAKAEIAKRLKDRHYSKYTAHFDAKYRQWTVVAYNDNDPPDSETYLLISPKGDLLKISREPNPEDR
jgi:hypothetical protein